MNENTTQTLIDHFNSVGTEAFNLMVQYNITRWCVHVVLLMIILMIMSYVYYRLIKADPETFEYNKNSILVLTGMLYLIIVPAILIGIKNNVINIFHPVAATISTIIKALGGVV